MKRKLLLAALASLVLLPVFASAQHGSTIEKQVTFAANKSFVSYKGRIVSRLVTHTYHLKARENQNLWVQLVAKNPEMTFQIFDPNDKEIGSLAGNERSWEGKTLASGEYTILVQAVRGAGNYTLNVKLK
jgi:hypothetical protein